MKVIGIIPARYESSRFPGKPLVDIKGKSMIQRVYEQASLAELDAVVIATDDERIMAHVSEFGGNAVLTSSDHSNGTSRCNAVLQNSEEKYDLVLNIQGDEPYLHPDQLRQLVGLFENPNVQIGTLIKKIDTIDELLNPDSIKKVAVNDNLEALYFSRSPIPFVQGVRQEKWLEHQTFYKHIGIYAFKADLLNELVNLPTSKLEMAESLEQLRWLENGYAIHTAITDHESPSIDTPADLERLLKE